MTAIGRRSTGPSALALIAGVPAGALAIGLAGLDTKYLVAIVAAFTALATMPALWGMGVLTPLLIVGLAAGLTVALSGSFYQHYSSPGQYVFNVGSAAGLTISLVFLVSLLLGLSFLADHRAGRRAFGLAIHPPLLFTQLSFMAAGIVSLVNAGDPVLVWLEELRLAQLILVFIVVTSFSKQDLMLFAAAMSVGVMLQAGVAALQVVTGSALGLGFLGDTGVTQEAIDFGSQSRATGFKGNPNILAYYFEILYPLCLAVALSRAGAGLRCLAFGGVMAALAGLTVTLSRGGWITVPPSTVLIIAFVFRDRLLRRSSLLALIGLFGLTAVAAVFAGPTIITRFTADDAGSTDARGPLNAAALSMIEQFPVAGVGLNNFGNMFPIYDRTGNARLFTNVDHVVHNLYLYVLGEVGIIGFLAFLAIFVVAGISALGSLGTAQRQLRFSVR